MSVKSLERGTIEQRLNGAQGAPSNWPEARQIRTSTSDAVPSIPDRRDSGPRVLVCSADHHPVSLRPVNSSFA